MKIVTVPKNRHTGWRWPKLIKGTFHCVLEFDKDSVYDLGNHDQKDWNKAIGIKTKFFRPHFESAMLGWRYNVKTQRFERTPYIHEGGKTIHSKKIIEVKQLQPVEVRMIPGVGMDITTDNKTISQSFNFKWKIGWMILHWFGGTSKAPKKVSFKYELI